MRGISLAALIMLTAPTHALGGSDDGVYSEPLPLPQSPPANTRLCYRTDLGSDCVDLRVSMRPRVELALPGAMRDDISSTDADALDDEDADPHRARPNEIEPAEASGLPRPARFGERGSTRLYLHGGYGVHVSRTSNDEWIAGLGVEHFIEEGLSLSVELNGLSIRQSGPNAQAANINLLFRWHVIMEKNWSAYMDGGAGLLFATEEVPNSGSEFNFTPQAGIGATYDLGGDVRLMAGVRWHHISNANTDSNNPGRDSALAYIGVSIPF
jgi:hypothetical protein